MQKRTLNIPLLFYIIGGFSKSILRLKFLLTPCFFVYNLTVSFCFALPRNVNRKIIQSFLIISLFLSYNIYAGNNNFLSTPENFKIYFIKNAWHVGIVFPVNNITESQLSILRNFKRYKYVDIGWGDAKFYQHSGINYLLAAEALLYPTPSVVRVQGYLLDIKYFIKWSDYTVSINVNKTQLKSLLTFIKNSLSKTKSGKYIISSTKFDGDVIFYKSNLKYYLFKTCNTWVADDLRYAGFKVSSFGIITAHQLFRELIKIGKVKKREE